MENTSTDILLNELADFGKGLQIRVNYE